MTSSTGAATCDRSQTSARTGQSSATSRRPTGRPLLVTLAEITASAFRAARVPPLLGRTLIAPDEQPGAPDVIVLGYRVWQQSFGGRADVVGEDVQLGRATATVVGVMPEGFTFPVNHQAWVPLHLRPSGYAPLEGGAIRIFGRLAPGATHRHVSAELTPWSNARRRPLRERTSISGQTSTHMEASPPTRDCWNTQRRIAPILLVLIIACTTVGTLVYARTATRESEIAVRSALGASRRRIVVQLFVEALVLASAAALVGLSAAHWGLKWGLTEFYSGQRAGPPFWMHSGLQLTTVIYAAGLAVAAAAMLGILPALKATGSHAHAQLRNLGSGRSTLQFGSVWSTAMIVQVALTVVAIPPAIGIAGEAVRDRMIRAQFPAGEYLAVPIELDRASGAADESEAAFAQRLERTYGELERRITQQPGVVAVTFADRLPGMDVARTWRGSRDISGSGADPSRQHVDGRRGSWFLRGIREANCDRPRVPLGRSRCRCADGDRERGVRPRAVHERRKSRRTAPAIYERRFKCPAAVARDRRDCARHGHDADRSRRGAVRFSRSVAEHRPADRDGCARRRRPGDPRATHTGDRRRPRAGTSPRRGAAARRRRRGVRTSAPWSRPERWWPSSPSACSSRRRASSR